MTLTLVGSIDPTIGTRYIVDAFLVVVVGGLGHLRGALLAAFALGKVPDFISWSGVDLRNEDLVKLLAG
ncbi:branched-chain amino acid ABC-type transport system, permease component [Frankia sp. QA3]|uniref:ABC transporter permease subunit n=1 Tax=Frankia sp. QA3 TaxID=710111 RepID=UPI000269BAB7|nr:branched-chain amino acid ABC-type transport system, permease component [Frankia sp. QA3]EIV90991.1 branched-chain amino acid ABC-type transport system, permease component [Frankia sp. QA3]